MIIFYPWPAGLITFMLSIQKRGLLLQTWRTWPDNRRIPIRNRPKIIEIRVHENIFKEYPTFRRGIVVAKKIKNRGHSQELKAMLNQAVAEAAKQLIDLKTDTRTTTWN